MSQRKPNRWSLTRRIGKLEVLEDRVTPDTTPFVLAGGDFSQDWSDTTLIDTDDDWANVPSVIGYRGDGLADGNDVDPQTVLGDGAGTPTDVHANRDDPAAFHTGGVAEFDLSNPVVALQGSGTADAPHLVISLDATGRRNLVLNYTLRDIDGSGDNSEQQVALQYRLNREGDFINLPVGFVADATAGDDAGPATAITATLPSDAHDQPVVEVRFLTTNATGNDEWVGVDDIAVTSDPIPSPFDDGVVGLIFEAPSILNTLTVSGDIDGTALAEQATGSLMTAFQGEFAAELDLNAGTVTFVAGANILDGQPYNFGFASLSPGEPADRGNPDSALGSADPADAGGTATYDNSGVEVGLDLALRELALDLSAAGPFDLTGAVPLATFDPAFDIEVIGGFGDYRVSEDAVDTDEGFDDLAGQTGTNASAGDATITVTDDGATLTIPIEFTFFVDAGLPGTSDGKVELTVSGQLLAVGTIPAVDLNGPDVAGLDSVPNAFGNPQGFLAGGGPLSAVDSEVFVNAPQVGSATITLTNPLDGEDEVLAADAAETGLTVGDYDPANGTIVITGTGTAADYQDVFATLTYDNTAADIDTTANRVVTIAFTDGNGLESFTSAAVIPVATGAGPNQPPVVEVPGDLSLFEEEALVFTAGEAITVTDPDSADDPVRLTLSAPSGGFTLGGRAGLTAVGGTADGDATVVVEGTVDAVNAGLESASFQPPADFTGDIDLTVTADDLGHNGDRGAKTGTATVSVTFVAVNDAPEVTAPDAAATNEDEPIEIQGISIADVDAGTAVVEVTLTTDGASGLLTLDKTGGVTFIGGTANGESLLTFEGTLGDINEALSSVTYAPDADFNGGDTLRITPDDRGNTGVGTPNVEPGTVTLTVNAVNDAPTVEAPTDVTSPSVGVQFGLDADPISVADVDAGDEDVTVTLVVTAGTLTLDASDLEITSGGNGTASVTFNATVDEANAALGELFYEPDGGTGDDTLTVTINDNGHAGSGGAEEAASEVAITVEDPPVFGVDDATLTASGFVIEFTQPADVEQVNLYNNSTDDLGPIDLIFAGPGGEVGGTAVFAADGRSLTFVATGGAPDAPGEGVLADGDYTITLASRADGFVSTDAELLDGDNDGTPGGDFSVTLTADSEGVSVGLPEFARGFTQNFAVDPTADVPSVPVGISDGAGVTSVVFTLLYDPALVEFDGAAPVVLGDDAAGDASVTFDADTPGQLVVEYAAGTALGAGRRDFVNLIGTVPDTAPYGAKQVLDVTALVVNGGGVAASDDDGLHVASFPGDPTNNAGYSGLDAFLALTYGSGIEAGFAGWPLTDPAVVGGVNPSAGNVGGLDAFQILNAGSGLDAPFIPERPTVPPPPPSGIDPRLFIPTDLTGRVGDTITVPVTMDVFDADIPQLASADFAITFDPAVFQVSNVRVAPAIGEFTASPNVDNAAGTLRVTTSDFAGSNPGFTVGDVVDLLLFDVTIVSGLGARPIDLAESVSPTTTSLGAPSGTLVLTPAPTNATDDAMVDGVVTIAPPVVAAINEIRIDQPSTDGDEYFELIGEPGDGLDGLTYIVIGDGSGGDGTIEAVINLDGQAIPADGIFLATEDSFTLFGATPDFVTTLDFENGDNVTHLLVRDFTGLITDDLDTDDDGTLDVEPWSEVVDSVALVGDGPSNEVYSTTTVGPDGTFVPGHVFRFVNESGDFRVGEFGAPVSEDTPGEENREPNVDPTADDDDATTDEDDDVLIDVLDGDADANAADTLAVGDIGVPANGTAVLEGGQIRYTPDGDFNGDDSFTYTVVDGRGGDATATVTVTVNPVNDAPVAVNDTGDTDEDTTVTIDALDNDTDLEGDDLSIDSVGDPNQGGSAVINGGQIDYTPPADFTGTETFTYVVSDGNGGSDSATVTVTVAAVNDDPDADPDAATTDEDTPVTIDVLDNDTDAEGDDLSLSAAGDPTNGSAEVIDGEIVYTPDADFNGQDNFTYTVSDGNGGADTGVVTVTVNPVNDDPAPIDDNVSVDEDGLATIDVLSNDADPDGDVSITVTEVGAPSDGTAVIVGGQVEYTPDADFAGTDSFTYTIEDGNGGSATAAVTVTVDPVNDAPAAEDDTAATSSGTAVEIDVLSNDVDVDGDDLAVTANDPANGTVSVDAGGTVTYTPDAGFTGDETFTYTVSDGNGGSDSATVTVTVDPNTPPAAADDAATTSEGAAVTIAVLDNDTDADGDTLEVTAAGDPANGSVSVDAGGTVTYTPDAGFTGDETFTYTVSDGNGGSDSATVTVAVTAGSTLPNVQQFAVGAGTGGNGSAQYYNEQSQLQFTAQPFGAFNGGVRTAVGDINGDGVGDLIAATGPGVANEVAAFDGATQEELFRINPFEATFTGGVFAAVGDVNGDGNADIIVTPDETGGPRVDVFTFGGGEAANLVTFFGIDDPDFRGGARASAEDVDGDGFADIFVSAGFLGGPRVALWDGESLTDGVGDAEADKLVDDFFVFEGGLRNGAFVSLGDVTGDGRADLIAGAGPGGGPRVRVFDAAAILAGDFDPIDPGNTDGVQVANFFGGDDANRGGVRVAAKDLDGDEFADVVIGAGDNGGALVTTYLGTALNGGGAPEIDGQFDAFDPDPIGGVFVG